MTRKWHHIKSLLNLLKLEKNEGLRIYSHGGKIFSVGNKSRGFILFVWIKLTWAESEWILANFCARGLFWVVDAVEVSENYKTTFEQSLSSWGNIFEKKTFGSSLQFYFFMSMNLCKHFKKWDLKLNFFISVIITFGEEKNSKEISERNQGFQFFWDLWISSFRFFFFLGNVVFEEKNKAK